MPSNQDPSTAAAPSKPKHPFWVELVAKLGKIILYTIGKTSRLSHEIHPESKTFIAEKKPRLYAFWHRYQLLLAYDNRRSDAYVLVSRSRDGELIARVLEELGYNLIRGSSSRGGVPALLQILDKLATGGAIAFTPDGPRGPYRSVAPGVVVAAQKSGLPIIPCAWAGKPVKALSSWDRFLIPLPFGRFHLVYGAPVWISPAEINPEEKIRAALDAAAAAAESFFEKNR